MRRASELIICFNIKSAGCDLVGRHGGKWSAGAGDSRAHKQVATVETLPLSAPPGTRSASEKHPRTSVCAHARIIRIRVCVAELTSQQQLQRRVRGKSRRDYRWRDLIKHVDCSPANFTVRVSPLNHIFFVAAGLAYVVGAAEMRDTHPSVNRVYRDSPAPPAAGSQFYFERDFLFRAAAPYHLD